MGWSYPGISIEDLMKLIKNFIDMLILASGYQSTGRLAQWDSHNIKRLLKWALFLENVSKGLRSSGDYEDCVKELDAALHLLTLSPVFPQGLAHLSCTTLGRARDLVLEHLIHPLPLRDSHLNAIMSASIEMDLSEHKRIDNDVLDAYLEKLMTLPSKGLSLSESRNSVEDLNLSTPEIVQSGKHDSSVDGDFTESAIKQLRKRQQAVSYISVVEAALENLWRTVGKNMHDELGNTSSSKPMNRSACLIAEKLPHETIVWNHWRSKSLSYMLDKRTIRLISGASLICSAPKDQWALMLKQLDISAESDDFCEKIELLLLGCVADRWSALIEHLMSVPYESLNISRLCHEVFNVPLRKPVNLCVKEGLVNPKEKSVVDYMESLLNGQTNQLWKLSPVLAAVAIPAWSQLFKSYLHELECQLRGDSLSTRTR
ncbi:hypothetical protein ACS0TY_007275 [Phlomoides rotata]